MAGWGGDNTRYHGIGVGWREIKDHSNIFDLKPLLTAVNTVAISSCECERTFSAMNNILTPKRTALSSKHLSSLLFINCVRPPLKLFIPSPYVHTWISNGRRNADEVCCPKRINKDIDASYMIDYLHSCVKTTAKNSII
ncbi:hypothetical protein QTP88_002271 [Uroleucon formosanum]